MKARPIQAGQIYHIRTISNNKQPAPCELTVRIMSKTVIG